MFIKIHTYYTYCNSHVKWVTCFESVCHNSENKSKKILTDKFVYRPKSNPDKSELNDI